MGFIYAFPFRKIDVYSYSYDIAVWGVQLYKKKVRISNFLYSTKGGHFFNGRIQCLKTMGEDFGLYLKRQFPPYEKLLELD